MVLWDADGLDRLTGLAGAAGVAVRLTEDALRLVLRVRGTEFGLRPSASGSMAGWLAKLVEPVFPARRSGAPRPPRPQRAALRPRVAGRRRGAQAAMPVG